jgi:hypothetical protein
LVGAGHDSLRSIFSTRAASCRESLPANLIVVCVQGAPLRGAADDVEQVAAGVAQVAGDGQQLGAGRGLVAGIAGRLDGLSL